MGRLEFSSKVNKRGDPNKRGGRKIFQNLINGVVLIRAWWVENVSRINKRVTLFIRQVRVHIFKCVK